MKSEKSLGKQVTKTTLARANQDRDCRIFEDFAYYMIAEAQRKLATDIFKLGGNSSRSISKLKNFGVPQRTQ